MEMTEPLKFEEQKVGKIKLSDAIRECGYGNPLSFHDCVLGRAYTKLTGGNLSSDAPVDGMRACTKFAASAFGVPFSVADRAEGMCIQRRSASMIADYVQAQGY